MTQRIRAQVDKYRDEAREVDAASYVFHCCIQVVGSIHIIHNLTLSAGQTMAGIASRVAGLKHVSALLHTRYIREAYVNRCIKGGHVAHLAWYFNIGIPNVIDWRRAVVMQVARNIMKLKSMSRSTCVAAKFAQRSRLM